MTGRRMYRIQQGDDYDAEVLLLMPSNGLGGGIERYARELAASLERQNYLVRLLAMEQDRPGRAPSIHAKAKFCVLALRAGLFGSPRTKLVIALVPEFAILASIVGKCLRLHRGSVVVIFFGRELWAASGFSRWVWRHLSITRLTISSYTAGALSYVGPASILPPPIPAQLYDCLSSNGPDHEVLTREPVTITSVLRLEDAEGKGIPELIASCHRLRAVGKNLALEVAGSGRAPQWLRTQLASVGDWVALSENLTEEELAALYLRSDIFVLATRTSSSRARPSGEGFGLALAEAALAGAAVIRPFAGGSSDIVSDGITGFAVTDESTEALTSTLLQILADPVRSRAIAKAGQVWVAQAYTPERFDDGVNRHLVPLIRGPS